MAQVIMPAIGAGTTHGKILEWRVTEGQDIRMGDILAEIETDKAVIELEALDEGVLQQILVPAGDQEVAVGEAIAVIGDQAGAQSADVPADVPAKPALLTPQAAPQPPGDSQGRPGLAPETRRIFASPSARRLARQHDVDLSDIQGSGPGGRIVRVDIQRAAGAASQGAAPKPVAATPAAGATPAMPSAAPVVVQPASADARSVPHSSIRKTIARRLQESKQQVPHFYLELDVRMDALSSLRRQLNTGLVQSGAALKLTLNDLIVYIAGLALQQSPDVNVRWSQDAMQFLPQADVSVAVATERGLITPVVRNVAGRRLGDVAGDLHSLIERAHAGRLGPSEYEGGGLTVSNLGMLGIRAFSAIINPPQAAILAVGAVERRPIVQDDEISIASMMTATLSADHRAIDGATAARFLARFRDLVQNPTLLLI